MSCRHYCIDNYKNFFKAINNNFFDHTLCEPFACIKSFVERGMAIFRYMLSLVLVTEENSIKYFAGILTRILGYAFFDNNVAFALRPVREAHCVNNSDKSTQGVKTPCYKEVDKLQRLFNELISVVYKKIFTKEDLLW